MTREEASKKLLDWVRYMENPDAVPNLDQPCTDDEIIEAMSVAGRALSELSLPEGLDEASKEYSRNLDYYHYTGDDPAVAFIAGAVWMAGQGETIEGQVTAIGERRWVDLDDSTIDKQLASFKDDDKVIVQVRKK